MEYGEVIKFDPDRAFGFIAPAGGGKDIFFHVSGLDRGTDPRQLRAGVQVSYEEQAGPKGNKAVRVKVIVSRPEDAWPEYASDVAERYPALAGASELQAVWNETMTAAWAHFLRRLGELGYLPE